MLQNAFRVLIVAVAVSCAAPFAYAQSDVGVVLMHGKQAPPGSVDDLAAKLRSVGTKVVRPQMPWGQGRWEQISVSVEAVHGQVDALVAQLRDQGARRIVVGGHSIGANVALSYAIERDNVAGVIMIGPGHAPGHFYQTMADVRAAVDRAASLVQAGQGAQSFSGPDNNQGRTFTVATTAEVYLSWMSPKRLANMPAQAPRLSSRIPVLMVIGSQDPAFGIAQARIFAPAAKHPYSKYVAIPGGDHRSVLGAAGNDAAEWLRGLPRGD